MEWNQICSIPGGDAKRGFRLRLVLFLAHSPRVFLPVLRFSSLHKTNIFEFQFDPETMEVKATSRIPLKFLFIHLFIYLSIYLFIYLLFSLFIYSLLHSRQERLTGFDCKVISPTILFYIRIQILVKKKKGSVRNNSTKQKDGSC